MADRKGYFKQCKLANKEQIKVQNAEWYKNNKEHIAAQQKQYRSDNADRRSEQITCNICGSCVSRHYLSRHRKTIKCMNHINP